jgi:NAD(P)-dependent dehydrogenase (short-subunit alcohol dehydrogenase family)
MNWTTEVEGGEAEVSADVDRRRVTMVTGGARGIGRAIAIALAEAGHDVATADIHPEPYRGEQYYRLRRCFDSTEENMACPAAWPLAM